MPPYCFNRHRNRWTSSSKPVKSGRFLVSASMIALGVAYFGFILLATVFANEPPHGNFLPSTSKCIKCHGVHGANVYPILRSNTGINPSSRTTGGPTVKTVCLTCHDGTGSQKDISRQAGKSYTMGIGGKITDTNVFDEPQNVTKTGTWAGDSSTGLYTTDTSATLTYRFTGTGITFVSRKEFVAGDAEITIRDSKSRIVAKTVLQTTGPLLNGGWSPLEAATYSNTGLPRGSYTITVRIDPASANPKIWVRGFRVQDEQEKMHFRSRQEIKRAPGLEQKGARHVECTDCHNPHRDRGPTHQLGTNQASGILTGVWGTAVSADASAGGTPVLTSVLEVKFEYQLCFRCHTYYAYGDDKPLDSKGRRQNDKSVDFNPNNASFHPVERAGRNLGISDGSFVEGTPMNPTSGNDPDTSVEGTVITCTDCHGSEEQSRASSNQWYSDWAGPHGSNNHSILKKPFSWNLSDVTSGNYLCLMCHRSEVYVGGSTSLSRGSVDGPHSVGLHGSFRMCQACHTPHGNSSYPHLLNQESVQWFTHNRDGGTCGPACHSGAAAWGMNYTHAYAHSCGAGDDGGYRRFEQGARATVPRTGEVECSFSNQDPTVNGWTTVFDAAASGGSFVSTSGTGSGYYTFTATGFRVYGVLSPSYPGTADVYVDEVLKGSFSTYAGSSQYQRVVFSSSGYDLNRHVMRITGKGTGAVNYDAVEFNQAEATAPAQISDLTAKTVDQSTIKLTWISPGDNGYQGNAVTYDIRYSTTGQITDDASFAAATQVIGEPTPKRGGSDEKFFVSGLANGTIYWFALKTGDNDGNWSALSNSPWEGTESQEVGLIKPAGLYISGRNNSNMLVWSANEEPGLAGYNVYEATDEAGPYVKLTATPTPDAFYSVSGKTNGDTYYYRVTAEDTDGDESPAATANSVPVATSPARVEQDGTVTYSGTWSSTSDASASAGSFKYSSQAGSSAEMTFKGSEITWVSRKSPADGRAAVFVDSVFADSIDLYNANRQYQKLVFTKKGLSSAVSHKIKVIVYGNQSKRSGGTLVSLDAFEYMAATAPTAPSPVYGAPGNGSIDLAWNENGESDIAGYNIYESESPGGPYTQINGSLVTVPSFSDTGKNNGTTYYYAVTAVDSGSDESPKSSELALTPSATAPERAEEDDPAMTYSATWNSSADAQASGGTFGFSATTDVTAAYDFYGNNIVWRATKSSNSGHARVFLDGVLAGTVDAYSSATAHQVPAFSAYNLAADDHRIEIIVAGAKHALSSGYRANIDAFDVYESPEPFAPAMLAATPGDSVIELSWNAGRESDLDGYNVYEARTAGGPWTKLNGALITEPYYQVSRDNGSGYYYSVTAVDTDENESARSGTAHAIPVDWATSNIEETSSKITFTGAWTSTADASASGGNYSYASSYGRTATLSREGQGTLAWISAKGPNRGRARAYMNNVLAGEVDLYSPSLRYQVPVFAAPAPTMITALKIEPIGAAHPGSTDTRVDLDAFRNISRDTTAPAMVSQLFATPRDSKVTLSWNARSEEDVDHYELRRAPSVSGPWTVVANPVVPYYEDSGLTNGVTYDYQVYAVDTSGNKSYGSDIVEGTPDAATHPRIEGETRELYQVDIMSSDAILTEGWATYTNGSDNSKRSPITGSRASLSFNGSRVSYYAFKRSDAGIAYIYVDGVLQASADLYQSGTFTGQLVYSASNFAFGPHTFDVVVSGTKNASSSNYYVYVDYYVILESSGNWTKETDASDSSGADLRTNGTNGWARYGFDGTGITWYAKKDPGFGQSSIYVDNVRLGTVDLYSPVPAYQVPVFNYEGLSAGRHEVVFEAPHKKNALSTGYYGVVDAFEYHQAVSPPPAPASLYATESDDAAIALSWNESLSDDVSEYLIYRGTSPGGPYDLATPDPVRQTFYVDTGLTPGQPYYYAVKARDEAGNDSAYSVEAGATPDTGRTRVEAEDYTFVDYPAATYSETWADDWSYSGESAMRSATTGQRASLSFTGSRVDYYGWRVGNTFGGTAGGIANIYIDNVFDGTVDLYTSGSVATDQLLYSKSDLPYGVHKIDVEVSGTKNAASNNYYIYVDYFYYWNTAYTGTWSAVAGGGRSAGSALYSRDVDEHALFSFSGTDATLLSTKAASRGASKIYIDGVLQDSIDMYSDITGYQVPVYTKRGLAPSQHSIMATVDPRRNPGSTSFYVEADAWEYTSGDAVAPPAPDAFYATVSNDSTVNLSWNADLSDDVSGYLIYRGTSPGGPYALATPDVIGQTFFTDTGLTQGQPYYYVVSAEDESGNESVYSDEAGATPDTVDRTRLETEPYTTVYDDSSSVLYSDGWSDYLNGSNHAERNLTTGERASFSFTGGRVEYYAFKRSDAGIANIYIDGVFQGSADLYCGCGTGYQPDQLVFTETDLPYGLHKIDVEVSGSKNGSSSNYYAYIDYFTSRSSAYTGTWGITSGGGRSAGAALSSRDLGSHSYLGFTGTEVVLMSTKAASRGASKIYIDGVLQDSINFYSAIAGYQVPVYSKQGLAVGDHSIQATIDPNRHGRSTSFYVEADAYDYVTEDSGPPPAPDSLYATASGDSFVKLSWDASSSEDVAGYLVYRGTASGGPYALATPDAINQTYFTDAGLVDGTPYYYVVKARDAAGSDSGYSAESSATPDSTTVRTRLEAEASTQVDYSAPSYSGSWSDYSYGGDYAKRSATTGDRASLTFTGSRVDYYAFKRADAGIANIYVDDVFQGTADLYCACGSGIQAGQLVYTKTNLSYGSHKLDIDVSGTKNGSSSNYYVYVDWLTHWKTGFSGNWSTLSEGNRSAGGALESRDIGGYARIEVGSIEFSVFTTKAVARGSADVYIDDVLQDTVNLYSPVTGYQVPIYTISGLAPGTHSIKFAVDENRDRAATSFYVEADAIDYVNGDIFPPDAPASLYATASGDTSAALSWNASLSDDVSGYLIYRGDAPGGPYSNVGGPVNQTFFTDTGLTTGQPYYYVVTARDPSGNESAYSAESEVTPDAIARVRQEAEPSSTINYSAVIYSDFWSDYLYGGNYAKYSASTGQRGTISFTGGRVEYYANKKADAGIANVYVDGVYQTAVDLYCACGSAPLTDQLVYTKTGLTAARHTIDVEVSGTKNGASTNYYVYVDYFKTYETGWSGSWSTSANSSKSAGAALTSTDPGAYDLFTFSGTSVSALSTKSASLGEIDVYVDNVFQDTINELSATTGYQVPVYSMTNLAAGNHSIKLTRSPLTSISVEADAFDYVTADPYAPDAPAPLFATATSDTDVALSWSASQSSDVTGYLVYRATSPGGPYSELTGSTIDRTFYSDGSLTSGQPYYYAVKARDTAGNDSAYSAEAVATPDSTVRSRIEAEDTTVDYPSALYSEYWSTYTYSGNSAAISASTNQRTSLSFRGGRVQYYAFKRNDAGIARIYIDGVLQTTVDLYQAGSTPSMGVLVYTKTGLSASLHKIDIEVSGTKNGSSSNYNVYVDYFVYYNSSPTGAWTSYSASNRSNSASIYSRDLTATNSVTFSGTEVSLLSAKSSNWGSARVYIDSVLQDTINLFSLETGYQIPVYTKRGLAAGDHTIRLNLDSGRNPASTGYYAETDAFDYLAADPTAPDAPTELYATASGDTQTALSWNASLSDDVSGYLVYQGTSPGGPYSLATPDAVNQTWYVDTGLTPGQPYYYVVQAKDSAGNASANSPEAAATPDATVKVRQEAEPSTTVDHTSGSNAYSEYWTTYVNGGNSAAINNVTNERVSLSFTGSQIAYYAAKRNDAGIARVYIDGVLQTTVDLYVGSSSPSWDQLVFTKYNLPYGLHKIDVEVSGTKNGSSSNYYVYLDYFIYNATSSVSAWPSASWAGRSAGATLYSRQVGGYNYFGKGMSEVSVLSTKATSRGSADIYIDGVFQATVNTYSPVTGYQVPIFTQRGLSPGEHSVQVYVDENRHASSTGFYVESDAFDFVTADAQPPDVPGSLYAAASDDTQVGLSWNASLSDDVSGYLVYQGTAPGGPYTLATPDAINQTWYLDSGLTPGQPYYYVVEAIDSAGNTSGYSSEAVATPDSTVRVRQEAEPSTTVDQSSADVAYSEYWTTYTYGGNSAASNNVTSERASLSFTGSQVAYYGFKRSTGGIARVYIDGVFQANVDLWQTSSTPSMGLLLYTKSDLQYGLHKIDLEVSGTKNASATDYYVYLDYFIYNATSRSGLWNTGSWAGRSASEALYSRRIGGYDFFKKGMTEVTVLSTKATSRGSADIYIDGVLQATVNTYSPVVGYQVPIFTQRGLSPDYHWVQVYVDENRHPASSAFYIESDAFDIVTADAQAPDAPATIYATVTSDTGIGLSWNASLSDDVSGYYVYRGTSPGGPYALASADAMNQTYFFDEGLTPSQPYYYVIKALDSAGNTSDNSTEASATPDSVSKIRQETEPTATVQDTDGIIIYSDTWSQSLNGPDSSYRNNVTNQRASLTFTGSQIYYYAFKRTDGGNVRIYVDGILQTTVDLYNPSTAVNQLVYSKSNLDYGQHKIDVEVAGTKNGASSNYYAYVDNFIYNATSRIGAWYTTNYSDRSAGSAIYSRRITGYDYFNAGMSQVTLIGEKAAYRGSADIYIDGVLQTTINNYSGNTGFQIPLYTRQGLSAGRHYVQVYVDENRHAAGSSFIIVPDAFDYVTADVQAPDAPASPYATATSDSGIILSWNASQSEDVSGYHVYRGTAEGGPYTIQTGPDPINQTFYRDDGLTASQPYYYVVKAIDSAGNTSDASSEAAATPDATAKSRVEGEGTTTEQDNGGGITYTGTWGSYACCSANAYRSNLTNDRASLTFTGSQISFYAFKASNAGQAKIYIDGVLQTTVDLYNASTQAGQLMYTKSDLTYGSHSIYVDVAGTKNALSSGYYVYVDYFLYNSLSRSGAWYVASGGDRSAAASLYSNTIGSQVYLKRSATELTLLSVKAASRGSADIYIDGVLQTTINLYSPVTGWQIPVYTKRGLAAGDHSIQAYIDENKSPNATAFTVEVDAIDNVP